MGSNPRPPGFARSGKDRWNMSIEIMYKKRFLSVVLYWTLLKIIEDENGRPSLWTAIVTGPTEMRLKFRLGIVRAHWMNYGLVQVLFSRWSTTDSKAHGRSGQEIYGNLGTIFLSFWCTFILYPAKDNCVDTLIPGMTFSDFFKRHNYLGHYLFSGKIC